MFTPDHHVLYICPHFFIFLSELRTWVARPLYMSSIYGNKKENKRATRQNKTTLEFSIKPLLFRKCPHSQHVPPPPFSAASSPRPPRRPPRDSKFHCIDSTPSFQLFLPLVPGGSMSPAPLHVSGARGGRYCTSSAWRGPWSGRPMPQCPSTAASARPRDTAAPSSAVRCDLLLVFSLFVIWIDLFLREFRVSL